MYKSLESIILKADLSKFLNNCNLVQSDLLNLPGNFFISKQVNTDKEGFLVNFLCLFFASKSTKVVVPNFFEFC